MPDSKDDDLEITRRDFVGGTLVGAGAALLGMASPGSVRVAQAQTVPSPLTHLGPDWTGPGGIGDYARSNGNTHEVVNAAHGGIRNQEFDKALRTSMDTGERPDVIIVGCGISGLSAAWEYRKSHPNGSVLMLDQHPIFGGEAKQNEFEVDGYHLTAPQGSTGFAYPMGQPPFDKVKPFLKELGFPDEFVFQKPTGMTKDILVPEDAWLPMHLGWQRSDAGFFYEGKGWVKNPWRDGFQNAPISESAKRALLVMELSRTPPRRDDWEKWLDSMTYLEFLRDVMHIREPDLTEVLRYLNPVMAAGACGLGADVISAYSAYNFFQPGVNGYLRYQNGGANPIDSIFIASFPGGNAGIARHLLKKIVPAALLVGTHRMADILNSPVQWEELDKPNEPVRMRLSSTVVAVSHEGDPQSAKGVVVTYSRGGKLYRVRAKAAILCGQQHANRHICRDISPDYRRAMNDFHHAPMHVINVAVRNWKFLEKIGIASARWFDGFGWWVSLRRNMEIPGQVTQPLDPAKPTVLTMYNPFVLPGVPFPQQCTAARLQLFGMSYAQIESSVREQFTKMFGDYGFDANRDIAGIISNRWGHAYVVDPPGFFFGKDGQPASRDVIRTRFNRLSFGHSELSGAQTWDTAAEEGQRAARQALEVT